jgi:hypothetical protein
MGYGNLVHKAATGHLVHSASGHLVHSVQPYTFSWYQWPSQKVGWSNSSWTAAYNAMVADTAPSYGTKNTLTCLSDYNWPGIVDYYCRASGIRFSTSGEKGVVVNSLQFNVSTLTTGQQLQISCYTRSNTYLPMGWATWTGSPKVTGITATGAQTGVLDAPLTLNNYTWLFLTFDPYSNPGAGNQHDGSISASSVGFIP